MAHHFKRFIFSSFHIAMDLRGILEEKVVEGPKKRNKRMT